MKSFLASKTIWLGILVSLIPVLQSLQALPMSTGTAQVISALLGLLIIINRFYTSQVVTLTKPTGDM